MKRLGLASVVLTVCGGVALWLGWPHLVELVRVRLERQVSRAIAGPARIDELNISLFPLGLHLGGISVGADPALIKVGHVDAQLFVLASVMEWRPVLTLRIGRVAADLTQLPRSGAPPPPSPTANSADLQLPPLQLRELDLANLELRFPMGKAAAHLTVGHLAAHAETALLGHGLAAGVEVQDVELERKSYQARIHLIELEGGADTGGLFVDHGRLEGDDISVAAQATAVPHHLAASANFNPSILGVVVDELSFVSGQAHVEGTLIGDLANPVLDARLTVQQGAIGSHLLGDLDTHVERVGPTFRFDDLRLVGRSGEVTGGVDLTVVHEVPLHGELTWHGVDLEGLLRVIGVHVPFGNRITATTAVHGALDPLDLDVRGTGALDTPDASAAKDVALFDIGAHVQPHDLDATLELTQAQQNRVTAEVVIAGTKFGGTASLKAADIGVLNGVLPRPVPDLALSGQGDASAEFSGTTEQPVVSGTLALRNFTVLGAAASKLAADFRIAAGAMAIKSAQLGTPTNGVELSGTLALDDRAINDWRVRLRDISTDLLLGVAYRLAKTQLPLGGGTLNGTIACKGPWRRAETDTNLVATAPKVEEEPLERIEVRATTALPRWTLYANALRTPSERLTIQGSGESTTSLQLAIDSAPLDLATLHRAQPRRLSGVVTIQGQVFGAVSQPSGTFDLGATGLGVGVHQLGDVSVHADGKAGIWTLKGAAFGDALSVDAQLRTVAGMPFSLALAWRDADLSRFVSADRSLSLVTSGAVTLSGAVSNPDDVSGLVRVTRFEVSRDQVRVDAPEPIQVGLERGRFHVDALQLVAAGSKLSIAGEGRLPADVDLDVHGEGDLVLLEVIGPPFYSARGQFGAAAHVAHNALERWTLRGQANLRNAALDMGLPLSFTDTNGDFALQGAKVLVQRLGGRAGGGAFHVTGEIDLRHGPELSWSLHDVGLSFPQWLEERISGKGRVEGTWQVLTVSGDIDVLSVLYDKKIELSGLIPWFKEQITPAPRIGPPTTEVELDLRIRAPDGVFVDNNFAKMEMSADLHVSGKATSPALDGKVEVLYGEVTVGSRVFTITGGSAVFQTGERLNPVLNITAESQIRSTDSEYMVRVAVTGSADNPRVQFSSDDPGLSQNDVLSLVTLGRTTHEQSRDSGVGVGDVLSLLPSEYTGDVSQHVRSIFRVDRFEVEPAYVRNTGTIEPRVTIGKDLTDRIRALASTSFGVEAQNTVQLEYRITSRISLLSTWESGTTSEAGAFGGDIKFRYEFRKLPFSLLSSDRGLPQQTDAH